MSVARAAQLVEAGVWLRLSGDHEGARKLFEQALRFDPQNARARQLLKEAGAPSPKPAPTVQNAFKLPPASPRPPPVSPPRAVSSAWDANAGPEQVLHARHEADDALDLLASETRNTPVPSARVVQQLDTLLRGVDDLLALDDHTSALELLAEAEKMAPGHIEIERRRRRSEAVLETMLQSKLGPPSAAPRRKLNDDEIIWLNLDHRAGFVLAQIDGSVSFDDLYAVCGMSRLDTARILVQLLEEGAIAVG